MDAGRRLLLKRRTIREGDPGHVILLSPSAPGKSVVVEAPRYESPRSQFSEREVQQLATYCLLLVTSVLLACVYGGVLSSGHDAIPALGTTAVGYLVVAAWLVRLNRFIEAWVHGGFAAFNATWVLLQLGIWHSWYGIDASSVPAVVTAYMAVWLALFALAAFAVARASAFLSTVVVLAIAAIGLDLASYHTSSVELLLHLMTIPLLGISVLCLGGVLAVLAFRGSAHIETDDQSPHGEARPSIPRERIEQVPRRW